MSSPSSTALELTHSHLSNEPQAFTSVRVLAQVAPSLHSLKAPLCAGSRAMFSAARHGWQTE